MSVGVGRIFESVCLFVCLFVRGITQKRMIPKCSNLVYGMTLGYPISDTVSDSNVKGSINTFFHTNVWSITQQEGWLSPTERASVSAISLRHILASPGYAPGTIAVNVTWMKRGFNSCQMHHSMYPSIFKRFPVIQPVSSKVRHFSTFLPIFAFPGHPLGQSW